VQSVESNPALQSAVQELGAALAQRHGGFQYGQRQVGHPQAADTDPIGLGQISATHPHSLASPRTPVQRHSDFHDGRRFWLETVPPSGGETADSGRLARPQRGSPDASVVGELAIGHEVHAGMQEEPSTRSEAPIYLPRRHTRGQGLVPADHPGLPPEYPLHTHRSQHGGRHRRIQA
jgi:hypothetical protein